jgi:hypothetical protein
MSAWHYDLCEASTIFAFQPRQGGITWDGSGLGCDSVDSKTCSERISSLRKYMINQSLKSHPLVGW